ncbi:unnamed protein product [Blepharisma stoltei]|uniref:Uncharacterized protein n=1 Tax=Blepharisma stoltei TaxID=1481888 RepID=A0AAU9IRI4_9CILI|nr:unnamed protein product [Blepharisma stoltei]
MNYFCFLLVSAIAYIIPNTFTQKDWEIILYTFQELAPDLELSQCGNKFCVKAERDISAGELLLGLSFKYIISPYDYNPLIHINATVQDALALYILHEKFNGNRGNFINSYVHSLPTETYLPLNWTLQQHELYQNLSLRWWPVQNSDEYLKRCQVFTEMFQSAKSALPSDLFECEAWKWAYSIKSMRTFKTHIRELQAFGRGGKSKEDGVVRIFLPGIDFIGYDKKRLGDSSGEFFVNFNKYPESMNLFAMRNFYEDYEVYNYYGAKSNFDMMNELGVVFERNPNDIFVISINSTENCLGSNSDNACHYQLGVKEINWNLFMYLISVNDKFSSDLKKYKSIATYFNIKTEYAEFPKEDEETILSFEKAMKTYHLILSRTYANFNAISWRELRRKSSEYTQPAEKLIWDYSVSERASFFEHLKNYDRSYLFYLLGSLKLF